MVKISYAITACNEHVELDRLLTQLDKHISVDDEIVLQMDTIATKEVREVAEKYNVGRSYEYHRVVCNLNNDFATFKNNLKDHCSRDYIFFIDADELVGRDLISDLKLILTHNPEVDCYAVPRINTVDGLTQEHIQKWLWRVDDNGWVNYPDYQTRICKNDPNIKWSGKVHEKLVGWKCGSHIPPDAPEYALLHHKTIDRQEKQNKFYEQL